MLFFINDYGEGAHNKILENLLKYNMDKQVGYGNDDFSLSAKRKIALTCGVRMQDVYLLTGGTQTNSIVIDSLLKSYEGVIAASSGHINVHEAGAIEAFGHKVITITGENGKINALKLDTFLKETFSNPTLEHTVIPKMVYISFPTEYGTLYSKNELKLLYEVCHKYDMLLFIDGARLGYGLASETNDLTIKDITTYSDVFYIGGTKVGALCGEAVVFSKQNMPKHFTTIVKRHGALLAKGRLLGIQFDTLFSDDLYFKISQNAIDNAKLLKQNLINKGYKMFIDSPTNQIFVIVSVDKMKVLSKNVGFEIWEKYDENHSVIRLVTSWATSKEDVEKLNEYL